MPSWEQVGGHLFIVGGLALVATFVGLIVWLVVVKARQAACGKMYAPGPDGALPDAVAQALVPLVGGTCKPNDLVQYTNCLGDGADAADPKKSAAELAKKCNGRLRCCAQDKDALTRAMTTMPSFDFTKTTDLEALGDDATRGTALCLYHVADRCGCSKRLVDAVGRAGVADADAKKAIQAVLEKAFAPMCTASMS
jgi:hypothetical protein